MASEPAVAGVAVTAEPQMAAEAAENCDGTVNRLTTDLNDKNDTDTASCKGFWNGNGKP